MGASASRRRRNETRAHNLVTKIIQGIVDEDEADEKMNLVYHFGTGWMAAGLDVEVGCNEMR